MNVLPIETIYDIYVNLKPSDILNMGQVLSTSIQNQHQINIVNSREFWDWYIKHKYFIRSYPQDIALRSERLIMELHQKQLYIPTYTLEYIFKYVPYDRIDEVLTVYHPQNLLPYTAIVEHFAGYKTPQNNEFLSDLIKLLNVDLRLPELPNTQRLKRFRLTHLQFHELLTQDEQRFYNKIISLETISTSYFVPDGTITVEYNPDMDYIIHDANIIPDYADVFMEYVRSGVTVMTRNIFMKYFAPLSF